MRRFVLLVLTAFFLQACEQKTTSGGVQKDIRPTKEYAMLIVESESCIYCKQLHKDLQKEEVRKVLSGVDVFSILYESNAKVTYRLKGKEGNTTEEELARSLGVSSFPQIFFYDKEGNILLHIPGYQPPKTLLCTINFIRQEQYKNQNYMDYLKQNQCT